jgi:hypothetical protein
MVSDHETPARPGSRSHTGAHGHSSICSRASPDTFVAGRPARFEAPAASSVSVPVSDFPRIDLGESPFDNSHMVDFMSTIRTFQKGSPCPRLTIPP